MKRLILYAFIIGFVLIGSSAFADFIPGAGSEGWQSWNTGNLNEDNNPYWDGNSWDGDEQNVGYYLTNSGGFLGSTDGPGVIPYWGNPDSTSSITDDMDLDFFFKSTSANRAVITFEIAGFKDDNIFGWYEVDSDMKHQLYNGIAGPGDVVDFNPGEDYGYYLTTPQGETFYTESSKNTAGTSIQHFAVFQDPTDYSFWIGVEDLVSDFRYKTDLDYNDFGIRVNAVPEPATMLLLGSGLIVIAGVGRKKILKKKGPNKS